MWFVVKCIKGTSVALKETKNSIFFFLIYGFEKALKHRLFVEITMMDNIELDALIPMF